MHVRDRNVQARPSLLRLSAKLRYPLPLPSDRLHLAGSWRNQFSYFKLVHLFCIVQLKQRFRNISEYFYMFYKQRSWPAPGVVKAVRLGRRWRAPSLCGGGGGGPHAVHSNKPLVFILPQWISLQYFLHFLILNTFEHNSPCRLCAPGNLQIASLCADVPTLGFSVFWMSFCC